MKTIEERIIVIGDIHGERIWQEIINRHPGEKYVFLGDYCDPYNSGLSDSDVLENLKLIIRLKKERPENVTLLLGNHDIQYIHDEAYRCSRYMYDASIRISKLFKKNIMLFEKVHHIRKVLFTHAGVTKEWFITTFNNAQTEDVVHAINECRDTKALFACGLSRWGHELYGGIFWADKREFENPLEGWTQVVGHSKVSVISLKEIDKHTAILFCDCLHSGKYLIIEHCSEALYFYTARIGEEEKELLYTIHL